MTGIVEELHRARLLLARGGLDQAQARAAIERGDRWITGLGDRKYDHGFAEEYSEVYGELELLRAMFSQRFRKRILALSIPQRLSRKYSALPRDQAAANLAAMMDPRSGNGDDPGYFKAQRAVLCSIEVEFVGNVWTQHPRVNYRARVRDHWALIINGREVLRGSRRLCMLQAHWAEMCDPTGALPRLEVMRGLEKRRALYKARKARRKPAKPRYVSKPPRLLVLGTHTNYVTGKRKEIVLNSRPRRAAGLRAAGVLAALALLSTTIGDDQWTPNSPPKPRSRPPK